MTLRQTLAASARPSWRGSVCHLWLAFVARLILSRSLLSLIDNAVTESRLYAYMREQLSRGAPDGWSGTLQALAVARALQVVAVGQGHGYPFNELVRTFVLGGITHGYEQSPR